MSGTEEAAGTRPTMTRNISRCPHCVRPMEAESHASRKCVYCHRRVDLDTPFHDRMSTWFLEFLPYVLWVVAGIVILIAMGKTYG